MNLPPKIEQWIKTGSFPQRVLLSGKGDLLPLGIEIAARLQDAPREKIENGIHPDTIVFRDLGRSFKVDFSDAAKDDEQSENENARGMVRWAHQKTTSPHRIVVLENLERMSRESLNAILKLIEEPPTRATFIFTTKNHHRLLDTILSRMVVVRLRDEDETMEIPEAVTTFLEGRNKIAKFKWIESLDKESKDNAQKKIDRSVFLNFLEQCIAQVRKEKMNHELLDLLLETHSAIGSNLSPRFAMERLVMKLGHR